MSLVRKQYRRQEDDVEDEFGDVMPDLKKSKNCAPSFNETIEEKPFSSFSSPILPLPIIYPFTSYENHPSEYEKSINNDQEVVRRPKKASESESAENFFFSSWYPFNSHLYGPLLSVPSDISSARLYYAKKGFKPSTVAKTQHFRPKNLECHSKAVTCVKWHPSTGSLLATSSLDGSLKIWDVLRSRSLIGAIFEKTGGINQLDFNEDGQRLFYGGFGKHLCEVDIETGKETMRVEVEGEITNLKNFERNFVFSTEFGSILSIDPREASKLSKWTPTHTQKDSHGHFAKRIHGIPGRISSFSFLPLSSSPQIMVTSDPHNAHDAENSVTIWDWREGRQISSGLWISPFPAFYCKAHPTLDQIAVLNSSDYPIQAYSAHKPFKKKKKKRFFAPTKNSTLRSQIDFSPDGTLLYLGNATGQVYIYRYSETQLLTTRPIFEVKEGISSLAHHPILHSMVAYGSWKGQIIVEK